MPFLKYRSELPRYKQLENLAHKNGTRHSVFESKKHFYVGEWKNSKKNGKGLAFNLKNQLIYDGNWNRGERYNFGTSLKNEDNIYKINYRGSWKSNEYNGTGLQFCKNGAIYKGEMINGKRNGFGFMWNNDGSFYAGNWSNGLKSGFGMLIYENGNRYEGEWRKGFKVGEGVFYHLAKCKKKLKAIQRGVWSYDNCVSGEIEYVLS